MKNVRKKNSSKLKHQFEYKKEVFIFTVGALAVFVVLMNLQNPVENPKRLTASVKNSKNQITPEVKPETRVHAFSSSKKPQTLNEKINYTILKVNKIEACFKTACNYPDNDPLEYSLSVYKDLSMRIKKYKGFWLKSWDKIPSHQKEKIVGLLSHDDGFVKKEILSLISKLPPKEASKYLDLVLKDVIGYHDSKLIPKALRLIKNITNSETELRISQSLSLALKQGGPHVSQEISKGIGVFISPKTADVYSKTLSQLPKSAPETVYLSSALTEYEMKKSGG